MWLIAELRVCVPQQADFFSLHVFDFCRYVCFAGKFHPSAYMSILYFIFVFCVFCALFCIYPKRGTWFGSSSLQAQSVMHRKFNIWFFITVTFHFTPELLLEGTVNKHLKNSVFPWFCPMEHLDITCCLLFHKIISCNTREDQKNPFSKFWGESRILQSCESHICHRKWLGDGDCGIHNFQVPFKNTYLDSRYRCIISFL